MINKNRMFRHPVFLLPERGDHMTNIQGTAVATVLQMQSYITRVNPKVAQSVLDMVPHYISEGETEGIRGDIAFAQSCLETGNFAFSGSAVSLNQNNFAGIGVTSNGMKGESWSNPQEGIRAQIQHLKAYATVSPLNNDCVDNRYKYVDKGCAPYVEWLGIQENPKKKGWAAGKDYGIKILNILNTIIKEGTGDTRMRINVHAGHNIAGFTACGAVGFINESIEDRKVKDEVISQLRTLGHTVYDCTVDRASSVSANLAQIVEKCNAHTVDLDVSIHFNSGANDVSGNGSTTGTEVWVYGTGTKVRTYAENVCKAIENLGFRNRGIKSSTGLYVLKHTSNPAMLIECCFVDDRDDVNKYNAKSMATAIVKGITGQTTSNDMPESSTKNFLSKGDTGNKVKELQHKLNQYGGYGLSEDGDYGQDTENAVKQFQAKFGLAVDGQAGTATIAKLDAAIAKTNGQWIKQDNKWWYKYKDGTYPKNCWKQIDGKWYHFDGSGWMQIGWLNLNGTWYYLNSNGAMAEGWIKSKELWYYLTPGSGAMKVGWLQLGEKWYYLKSTGVMACNELLMIGKEPFYFMSDGHMGRTNARGALV